MHRFGLSSPGAPPLASPAFGIDSAPHGALASSFGVTKLSRDDEPMAAGLGQAFSQHFAPTDTWVDPLLDPALSIAYGPIGGVLSGSIGNTVTDAIGAAKQPAAAKPAVRFLGEGGTGESSLSAAGRPAVPHPIASPAGGGYLVRGASEHVAAFFGAGAEYLMSPTRPAARAKKTAGRGAAMPMDGFSAAPVMAAGSAHALSTFGGAGTAAASAQSASTMHAEASYRSAPVSGMSAMSVASATGFRSSAAPTMPYPPMATPGAHASVMSVPVAGGGRPVAVYPGAATATMASPTSTAVIPSTAIPVDRVAVKPADTAPVRELTRLAYTRLPQVTQTALARSQAAVDCCITSMTRSAVIPAFAPLGKPLTRRDGIIVTATELQSLDISVSGGSARDSSSASTTSGPSNAFIISWVPDPTSAHMKAPHRVWLVPFTKAVPHENGAPGAPVAISGFVHDMTWLDDGCTLVLAAVGSMFVTLALPAGPPSSWDSAAMVLSVVHVTQPGAGRTVKLPAAHTADIWSVAASPTLAYVAAGGFDGKISIYSLDRPSSTAVSASLMHVVEVGRAATCMRFHPTRCDILLVALEAGGCICVNVESGVVIEHKRSVPDAAFACAWVHDRAAIVGTGCGRIVKSDLVEFSVTQIDDPIVAEIGEIAIQQQPGCNVIACSGAGGVSVWQLLDHASRPSATLIANVPLHRPSTAPIYPPPGLPGATAPDAASAAMIAELGLQDRVSAYQYPLAAKATAAFMTYGSSAASSSSSSAGATFLVVTDSFGGLQMFDVAVFKPPTTAAATYDWLPVAAPPARAPSPPTAAVDGARSIGRSAAASATTKPSAPGARGSLAATMLSAADVASWQIKDTIGDVFLVPPLPPAPAAAAGAASHRNGRAASGPFSGGGSLRGLPLLEDDDALLHGMGIGIGMDVFHPAAAAGVRGVPAPPHAPQAPVAAWHGPRGSLTHDDDMMIAEV